MEDGKEQHYVTEHSLGRKLFLWLVTMSVGILLALVTTEVALRVSGLVPSKELRTVTESQFNAIPGLFAPGQAFVSRKNPALPYTITIDNRGFRVTGGGDQSHGPPTILYIGDSFTFGDYVDDAESLPALLEASLRERCENIRVINAGVGGTTIVDHQHILNRTLSSTTDLVILQFSENDVEDLLGVPSVWDGLASNRQRKSEFPLSVVYPTLRNTALWNAGLQAYGAYREHRKIRQVQPLPVERQDSIMLAMRDQYQRALYQFRDSVAPRGVPLLLVMYPNHEEVLQGNSEQMDWLEEIARNGDIPSVNLLGPLAESGLSSTELFLFPHDGHASPRGYAIAAEFLISKAFSDSRAGNPCASGSSLQDWTSGDHDAKPAPSFAPLQGSIATLVPNPGP